MLPLLLLALPACTSRSGLLDSSADGAQLDAAIACGEGPVCTEPAEISAVGDIANVEGLEIGGDGVVVAAGDDLLMAAMVATVAFGGTVQTVIQHWNADAMRGEQIDLIADPAGPARAAASPAEAVVFVPTSDSTVRYHMLADGSVQRSAAPRDGAIAAVSAGGIDVSLEYAAPSLHVHHWSPDGARTIAGTLDLTGIAPAGVVGVHGLQATVASRGRVAAALTGVSECIVVWLDLESMTLLGSSAVVRGCRNTRRRAIAPWRDGVVVLAQREHDGVPGSDLMYVTPDAVSVVGPVDEPLFVREAVPALDGSVLMLGSLVPDGAEATSDGRPNDAASTYVLRLSTNGCLTGSGAPLFRSAATPLAISSYGLGAAVLGSRNPGLPGLELQLGLICSSLD